MITELGVTGMNEERGHPSRVPSSRPGSGDGALVEVLEESRRRGLVGSTPLGRQIEHARAMGRCVPLVGRILDLGAGGGLPGLVLAHDAAGTVAGHGSSTRFTLLDSAARRCRFLSWAVEQLELGGLVEVVHGRAEEVAARSGYREAFDRVVSRSFGPPAVAAECGRGFLVPGGEMVVSEPPEPDTDRWPASGLSLLGFDPARSCSGEQRAGRFVVLRASGPVPEGVPRRSGIPARRPRF